jgi:RNA polymerase sigma-70 factor, ECF subfamily
MHFCATRQPLDGGEKVESTKAYLSAVVTRLAIDELRSARKRRETYSGEWLPEPIVTDDLEPESRVVEAESLTMSFLLLLDRLSPVERTTRTRPSRPARSWRGSVRAIASSSPASSRTLKTRSMAGRSWMA